MFLQKMQKGIDTSCRIKTTQAVNIEQMRNQKYKTCCQNESQTEGS